MKFIIKSQHLKIVFIILIICVIITNYKTLYLDYYFNTVFPLYSVEEYYNKNWLDNPVELCSEENAPILAAKIKVNFMSLCVTKLFMKAKYDSSDDKIVDRTYSFMNLPNWWIINRDVKVEEIYTGYGHRKNISIIDNNGKTVEAARISYECDIYVVRENGGMYLYIISVL